jgi:AcrR family transcriptional regulator
VLNLFRMKKSAKMSNRQPLRLGSDAWLRAARAALINGGIGSVKIVPLAKVLGVTSGSFYWHFKSLQSLRDALLQDWKKTNTEPLFAAVAAHSNSGARQFDALVNVWINETNYSPAWDAAMRDWARVSPKVEAAVRRIDEKRIELLRTVFKRLGFAGPKAFLRARVTYFHQVGYYALRIVESRAQRLRLKPLYMEVLRGRA